MATLSPSRKGSFTLRLLLFIVCSGQIQSSRSRAADPEQQIQSSRSRAADAERALPVAAAACSPAPN
ncbi:hypothetical protein EYF80_045683 [Liparis tanakae]|uniref:Uncharacterized protein n=1 Tax=Liparis tanakae TaxID=230148 RepID=A0A4Z2FSB4_9TELE|nr:hypothetical protein EYF80_045683 [Liparis tanakae]